MKKTFFSNQARLIKSFSTRSMKNEYSEGQKALDEVKSLCAERKYEEALRKISVIEDVYPGCGKAAKFYRGEATYELLKERGELPILTHMKN